MGDIVWSWNDWGQFHLALVVDEYHVAYVMPFVVLVISCYGLTAALSSHCGQHPMSAMVIVYSWLH